MAERGEGDIIRVVFIKNFILQWIKKWLFFKTYKKVPSNVDLPF